MGGRLAAEVRMRGAWLARAGLHPGARLAVSNPSPGVLELRICSLAQLRSEDFTAALAPLERLGL